MVIVARMAKVILEKVEMCVQKDVEFGEEVHWVGEIGFIKGWYFV